MKWIVTAACVMIVIGAAISVLMPKKSADQMEGIEEAAETELMEEEWVDVPYMVEGDVAWTSEAYMIPMDNSREMEIL